MDTTDVSELLKLIEEETKALDKKHEAPPEPSNRYSFKPNKNVERFIRTTGLIPGDNKVPTYLIYYHYIFWAKDHWLKPLRKQGFFRTFNQHFQQKRSGHQRYYMINDGLDLSDEIYDKAKKYETKWHKNRKKAKKPEGK